MAASIIPEQNSDSAVDRDQAFIDRVAARYEKEDAATMEQEDGGGDEEDSATGTQDDEAKDEGTEEHTDAGTSATPDGESAESDEDSTAGDEDEHPDDADDEDAADDSDDDDAPADDSIDEDEQDEEEEEDVSDDTKAALTKHGAVLTLDDLPAEARPLVAAKLRNIDAAFSRAMQEGTAFRAERAKSQGEEKFRTEHPDLFIIEMLEKDPELMAKINTRYEKLEDEDQAAAFKIIVKDARSKAVNEVTTAQAEWERTLARGEAVESSAKALASKANVPWRLVERAVESALLKKPADVRDLTDAELQTIVNAEAKEYSNERRALTRTASKDAVKARTAAATKVRPVIRTPASSVSPTPAPKKPPKVDQSSEESRHAAMMRTARRLAPGTK